MYGNRAIVSKNYTSIFDALRGKHGSASISFECLSETSRVSASLSVERANPLKDGDDRMLQVTFGQNSTSGSSIADMRERVSVYEQAIEYGELLKARLKAEGFTFTCDETT